VLFSGSCSALSGWLIVALGPDYKTARESKKCPFCAELVKKEAKVCKHCGRDLPGAETQERLEAVARAVRSHTMEDGFVQALGQYLCALRNSVSTYENLTRVMGHHSRKQRLRGAYRVFRLRRDFDRTVDDYRRRDFVLQEAWNALETPNRATQMTASRRTAQF
jgi:hypothetical protein